MNSGNSVQIVEVPEIKLVGFSVTCSFNGHIHERVEKMKREFYERKEEIRNKVHPERYISPCFSSEVLFTYLICMEVSDLSEVPEGMIGFTVPPHRYATTKCQGDPYQVIHDYLGSIGLQSDKRALALEIYSLANPVWPDETEVLLPLKKAE
ncbi:GyrI-like domain-containing protein [Paenibacillus contaminans]|uniref:AraC family transcriptional regulator n=1 Tax=Paenibacillus contaminans TaxID=450362 RepID=A0A329MSF8_9BACL|nr:GyrI-like domain-containing protein [Paenibacillus contaminans]RAV22875.1 AraC family transcriptional regulator [Paenibacillus contaminans]